MKTRILYVTSTLEKCGPNNQLLGIIKGLDSDKFDTVVLTLSPEKRNSMIEEFKQNSISVQSLNLSRLRFLLYGKNSLKTYIEKFKPDIIHTQGVRADHTTGKISTYRNKHCMTIRNYIYEDYVDKYGKLRGIYFCFLHYKAIEKARYPVCCSKTLADKYEKLFCRSFMYVQNGADSMKYCVKMEGAKRTKIYLVMAGDLISRKDPVLIINAFNKVPDNERMELHILGDGPLMSECKKIKSKNVYLHGVVQDVVPYLQEADYYVSASHSEGLPNSVLEAGLCGCKFILSNIPQHREVTDGVRNQDKIFFNIGNTEELQEKISLCQRKTEKYEKENIRNVFMERFSSDVMSGEYQRLYEKIIGENR